MKSADIHCPSGLRGRIRALAVREANELANAVGTKARLGVTGKILSGCWEETYEMGPYPFDGAVTWDRVLQADCDFLLIEIRKVTHGADYDFGVTCSERECRARFDWHVDLNLLPVIRFDEEDAKLFANGNTYYTKLPESTEKVTFSLPLHSIQKRAGTMKASNRNELITLSLRLRISEIEGVEIHNLPGFITDMPLGVAQELVDLMDEQDCGLDTDIEVVCPECFAVQEMQLPLGREFWYPDTKVKKARKKKEAAAAAALQSSTI